LTPERGFESVKTSGEGLPSDELSARVRHGDPRAVARAISLIENGAAGARTLAGQLHRHGGHAFVVGVTGAPGSGKSTLVDRLVATVRRTGPTVAVVAVDPSSPFTGGAVLGDRVRMSGHSEDPGVFVRSMATRGHLGGLASATGDAVAVLDAAGRDVILVETVGVGQDEVEIMRLAAVTILVLVPGTGDDVQALKAGVMEIADVFVVNKADRPDADRLVETVASTLALRRYDDGEWRPPILKTEAVRAVGVDEVWDAVRRCREHRAAHGRDSREHDRHAARLRDAVSRRAAEQVAAQVTAQEWAQAVSDVMARIVDPDTAADRLLARAFAPNVRTDVP
jgi:LAO/AO transport system kinase